MDFDWDAKPQSTHSRAASLLDAHVNGDEIAASLSNAVTAGASRAAAEAKSSVTNAVSAAAPLADLLSQTQQPTYAQDKKEEHQYERVGLFASSQPM